MKHTSRWLIFLFFSTGIYFAHAKEPLIVATYNLRLDIASDGINAWPNRKENVKALILYHEFDIIGTQEGFYHQLNDLLESGDFEYVGAGRDDGLHAGEHSAIFFRKGRFDLLKNGDFWLSETPDKPSFGWEAKFKRICSWAELHDRLTGNGFYVFNVHFDHEAKIAREQSALLLISKIGEIAGSKPLICLGDFNSIPETNQIKNMKSFLNDAYDISESPPYGPAGTFNGFKTDAPLTDRIDYVFVSGHFRVMKYGVLTDNHKQLYPSDHFPVVAKIVVEP